MPQNADIVKTILATATERGNDKSTCPSEIARMMFPDNWRKHMQEIRDVAIDLHKNGKVIISQKGSDKIKGPIRIKIK